MGHPINNVHVYVDEHLSPVPIGAPQTYL